MGFNLSSAILLPLKLQSKKAPVCNTPFTWIAPWTQSLKYITTNHLHWYSGWLQRDTGLDGTVARSSANGRYWVHISVLAPTQSGFLKAQWVGVRPQHPLISH